MRNRAGSPAYPLWLPGLASMLLMSLVFLLAPFAYLAALRDAEFVKRAILATGFNLVWGAALPYALLVLPKLLARLVGGAFVVLAVVFAVFSTLHLRLYGQLIAAPSVSALLDTSPAEAKEFLAFGSQPSTLLAVGTVLAVSLLLARIVLGGLADLANRNIPKTYSWLALVLIIGLTVFGWNRVTFSTKNPLTFTVQTFDEVLANRSAFVQMRNVEPEPSGAVWEAAGRDAATHVIVIGESATSSHLSLYGYSRITDAFAVASAREGVPGARFFYSQDACSSQPNTQLSLADVMLAERTLGGPGVATAPPNMISILKDAGFTVYWISNQAGGAGTFYLGSIWGYFADKSEFLNRRDFREGYDFDEILLPALAKALADPAPRKIIFVHLLGSHPDYKQRYTSEFQRWELGSEVPASVPRRADEDFDRALYNAYDNSLVYTDHILSEITGMSLAAGALSVTYFSDHGNNLGETTPNIGHSLTTGPRQGFEIPIWFWIAEPYAAERPAAFENLQANLHKPVALDIIQYTLFELYGIELPGADAKRSWLSAQFVPGKRQCDEL